MNWIDFHCHLGFDQYQEIWKDLVDQCFNQGFARIVTVADPTESNAVDRTKEILGYGKQIYAITGVHPHRAKDFSAQHEQDIRALIMEKKVIALGEIGLDFHYQYSSPEQQRFVFRHQVRLAKEISVPLVIHSREAEGEVLQILAEEAFTQPVIFHCYSGDEKAAEEIFKREYSLSFSGIITFKNADYLREIVRLTPLDRIFTETDSPFLSPEPFRGKVNTPLRVKWVAEKVAELKGLSPQELNGHINDNFNRNFLKKDKLD